MLTTGLTTVLDLVLPQTCAGCGAGGARWCAGCHAELVGAPARRSPEPVPDGLPDCWSAAPYEGAVRRAVVAYKERGAVALAEVLAEAVAFTIVTAVNGVTAVHDTMAVHDTTAVNGVMAVHDTTAPWAGGRFAVVPVPSARRTRRHRGHDPVGRLAVLAAGRLRAWGLRAETWPALGQARRVADQAGLSSAERSSNLAGSLRVRRTPKGPPVACAVLLDDIVTTGATLVEAARALSSAGVRVPLAATVAATRRRS
ncbi:ComF family protein [Nonomuraea angiospora]|uniref:ComF family protein n=1 Tax=Nonomuraea angiospora TaxID=46172 RepID=UPI00341C3A32